MGHTSGFVAGTRYVSDSAVSKEYRNDSPVIRVMLSDGSFFECGKDQIIYSVSGEGFSAADSFGKELCQDVFVSSIVESGIKEVFDITVEGEEHTYYIYAENNKIKVHNLSIGEYLGAIKKLVYSTNKTTSLDQIKQVFNTFGDVYISDGRVYFSELPPGHIDGDAYYIQFSQGDSSNGDSGYSVRFDTDGYEVYNNISGYSEVGAEEQLHAIGSTFPSRDVVGRKVRFHIPSSVSIKVWAENLSVSSGNVYYSDGKYYTPTSNFTTGNVQPTHKSGIRSDGKGDWRYLHDGYGIVTIKEVPDENTFIGDIDGYLPVLSTSSPSYEFDTYQWSMWGYKGVYPHKVFMHSGRLGYILNTDGYGSWLQMSKSDQFNDFDVQDGGRTTDTCGINVVITGHDDNRITWVLSGYRLYVGSYSGEYNIRGSSGSGVITPSSLAVLPVSGVGGADVDAIKYKDLNLFAGPTSQILYSLQYDYSTDDYVPEDLTSIGESLLEEGIKRMCVIKNSENLVAYTVGESDMRYMSFEEDIKKLSLFRTDIGGKVYDTTVSESGGLTTQFILVRRDDRVAVEFVDSLAPCYMLSTRHKTEEENSVERRLFDLSLAGQRIYVVNGDTNEYYDTTVGEDGEFENKFDATSVFWGLPMPCELHMNPAYNEKMNGAVQKSVRFSIRVYNSGAFSYGSSNDFSKWYKYENPEFKNLTHMTGDLMLPSSFGYMQGRNTGESLYPNDTGTALNLWSDVPEEFNLLMVNEIYV